MSSVKKAIKIGFYGMTHLGLVSAIAAASKGYQVICFDEDHGLIAQLQKQHYPIEEPNFPELTQKHADRLQWTDQLKILLTAELIYISIDVPTNGENQSDLTSIEDAIESLKNLLHPEQLVVILSQVPPGFTRSRCFSVNPLFYQVETLVFGSAVERATQPERLIVGCADPAKNLPKIYHEFLQAFHCPIFSMRYESAELAKIAINMYLVASVMTSNLLSDLAASLGADWEEVIPTLRQDKRIGPYAYLNPGLGISGGNLERDMVTILQQADKHRVYAELIKTWLTDNGYYRNWVWRCLQQNVLTKIHAPSVVILGLAYKANTHSIKNSPAIQLINQLKENTQARLWAHDPWVKETIPGVERCDNVFSALQLAEVLVIMTPWPRYAELSVDDFLSHMPGRVIIDPYRLLNHGKLISAGFSIDTLGVGYKNLAISAKELFYA